MGGYRLRYFFFIFVWVFLACCFRILHPCVFCIKKSGIMTFLKGFPALVRSVDGRK